MEDMLFLGYKAYMVTISIILLAVLIERYLEVPDPPKLRVKKSTNGIPRRAKTD